MPTSFGNLNLDLLMKMADAGVQPRDLSSYQGDVPYTAAGVYPSNSNFYTMKDMSDGVDGVTFNSKDGRKIAVVLNGSQRDSYTLPHEIEHVLANQGLGHGTKINSKFTELSGDPPETGLMDRRDIVDSLVNAAPYLVKNWGLSQMDADKGYFSKPMFDFQGVYAGNLLKEQFATLSALEQAKNKRLVDDPYIRQHVLTTPAQRESYDAVTGLRQTRLDARDLPPYTRLPEARPVQKTIGATPPADVPWMQKLMQLLK